MVNLISRVLMALRKLTTRAVEVTFSTNDFYLAWAYQELVLSESSIPKVGDVLQLKGILMIVSEVNTFLSLGLPGATVRVLSIHGIVNNPWGFAYPFPQWILDRAHQYLQDPSSFEVTDLEKIILEKIEYEDPELDPEVLGPQYLLVNT